jgi:hypothetical protein
VLPCILGASASARGFGDNEAKELLLLCAGLITEMTQLYLPKVVEEAQWPWQFFFFFGEVQST